MLRNQTVRLGKVGKVPSRLLGWSLCGLLAGAIAPTANAAKLPTSDTDNSNTPIVQNRCDRSPSRLKLGSGGREVIELQAALKLLGFYSDTVDGIFSQSTASAVSKFQGGGGTAPDGIVGQDTWNRLFPASEQRECQPSCNCC